MKGILKMSPSTFIKLFALGIMLGVVASYVMEYHALWIAVAIMFIGILLEPTEERPHA